VAEDIVLLKNHVAEIDPDPKQDTPLFGDTPPRSSIPRWISIAQRTASVTLENSDKNPSPVFSSVRPLCSLIFGSTNCPLGFGALVHSLLIGLPPAAIVRDIGLEDRREPALTLACQLRIPLI